MTILLTGFNAFGNVAVNPSQLIVQAIQERFDHDCREGLVSEILPTEFNAAEKRITELILKHQPQWVLALGVSAHSTCISLERVALNLDDADTPDNKGELRVGLPIALDGPAAYFSTLPLQKMHEALKNIDIPAMFSNHAGTYVCNHVFYSARHTVERMGLKTRCGFVHVPPAKDGSESGGYQSHGLPIDLMIKGIECCLSLFVD